MKATDAVGRASDDSDLRQGAGQLSPQLAPGPGNLAPAPADPELARLVEAWPALPPPIRRAMLALVDSTAGRPG